MGNTLFAMKPACEKPPKSKQERGDRTWASDSAATPTKLKSLKWNKELLLRNSIKNPADVNDKQAE